MITAPTESVSVLGRPAVAASSARVAWLAALGLAAMHLALKASHLGSNSLWLDEAVAVHISQLGPWDIVLASRQDTTPPLYYLLLGGFERLFGISEAAVRWLSVLASGATASGLFLLARRRLGEFAAWLASALFLLSDVNLHFAREARPYALASLLCVASFALFLRALERPSLPPWLALAAVNGLMLFTHYATVFALASQAMVLSWPWRGWAAIRRFTLAHLPVVAAFLAWVLPLMAAGQHHKMDWLAPPDPRQLGTLLNWFVSGNRGGPGFALLLLVVSTAFAWARLRGRPVRWDLVKVLVIWGFGPIVLAFLVSLFFRCFHERYLLYATPGLTLLWAASAQALPAGRGRLAVAAVACVIATLGLGRGKACHATDWRGAAELVKAGPTERVLLAPSWESQTFAYYYDREAFRDEERTTERLATDGVRLVDERAAPAALDVDGAREVTLVAGGPRAAALGVERQLASRGFAASERRDLLGVTVERYSRSAAAGPAEAWRRRR